MSTLKKPTLNAALAFAESTPAKREKPDRAKVKGGGQVPDGDARLTVNLRDDVHQKLKIRAVKERTTVGELIESWVDSWR